VEHHAPRVGGPAGQLVLSTGFTDGHFFRDRGISAYGDAPFLTPGADESGARGNNERISIENVRTGTQMTCEIVRSMVGR
jgi:acetylornithine deacetylase/succinyl-diaminopimelate desuccinylase-like protein